MGNYFPQYCALLNSVEQLEYCQRAQSLGELLACIKTLWECNQLGDGELLGEINRLNQMPVDANAILAGNWLPYRYQPKRRVVNWLIPVGHATEPFQDEYISRCRQQLLLNQIIQPCTSLESVAQQGDSLADVTPAGFIFHLSRCGSTLVSGCLAAFDSACVFSESPLLTELLLDGTLSSAEQKNFLRVFINLQSAVFSSHRPKMVIKWNAWDIFQWELIRALYPQVPVIFLVRNPVEVLASHQRSAGRHMMDDPRLSSFHPVFAQQIADIPLLEKRTDVLHALLQAMGNVCSGENISVVDYVFLSASALIAIAELMGMSDQLGFLKIQERMQFHSKSPGQIYVDDSIRKQECFTLEEQHKINAQLMPSYNHLLANARKPARKIISVN
ncbi:sulfotransferase family protein [Cellvibrio mixtus]|uniref:sulfotransferase family protein n=1 Tax=Cellvibrio mixtus TaxID=39650 RepID=UPI000586B5F2|nr:sulfotransferase family protein [Cellvibrio mixtus]